MNQYRFFSVLGAALLAGMFSCEGEKKEADVKVEVSEGLPALKVSENQRFFQTEEGEPIFWLGDTGWLLLNKLTRER